MIRRATVMTVLTGAVLIAGLGTPALADPAIPDTEPTIVCLRLDPEGGREGVCVWLPVR